MSKATEFTGKTVEAATAEAERALGKSRDGLEIQVVSQGSRGVFGLGGEPARILARDPEAIDTTNEPGPAVSDESSAAADTPELQETFAAAADLQVTPPEVSEPAPGPEPRRRRERTDEDEARTPAVPAAELGPAAREALQTLLNKMGFDDVEVSVRPGDDPVTLDVHGDDLGILIGRRGDSLASLQFMLNVILSKQFHTWPRVVVDVQGYRERREQSLGSLGERVAERVRRNRRPFTLEAMPANDRRVIHITLRDRSDVETYSVGEGQSRRVVIAPKK